MVAERDWPTVIVLLLCAVVMGNIGRKISAVKKQKFQPGTPTFYEQNGTIQGILSGINSRSAEATILTFVNIPTFEYHNQQRRQAFETIQVLQLQVLQLGEKEAHQFVYVSVC